MSRRFIVAMLLGAMVVALTAAAAQSSADGPVQIVTLSNRADLVSGGDVLVEVVLPDRADPADVVVTAGNQDVTEAFEVRDDGRYFGLVEDLPVGTTRLTATLTDRSGAYLDLTNHPIGGPVFAGPQVQPWICTTQDAGLGPAEDEQCNAPTIFELLYKPQDGGDFQAYDPDNPPDDVAQTTTDEGVTVPYIVRRERGVIDRGVYDIAVLFDPAQPWEPWSPQPAWNHKLFYRFGGDCNPSHRQPANSGAVLNDHALSRGFAVASSGLNVLGKDCNDVVSAEAVVMVKEHLVERYGEIRYTMSEGESGGSMQQHWIVSNYPGVLDGIMPSASFPDIWQTLLEAEDCVLLDRAFLPAGIVAPGQITAVTGHESIRACNASAWPLFARVWQDPAFDFGCQGGASHAPASAEPAPWAYDPVTNPTGSRCTLHDYQVAQFGRRPEEVWTGPEQQAGGFANRPFDNVGVEYGRDALESGAITPEQFVGLNENIGGYDIDWVPQAERNVADPFALIAAYRGGRVTYPRAAATVPILDIRGSIQNPCNSDAAFEIHTCFHTYAMRARLVAANGHAKNQVILYQPPANYAFDLMDVWLTAIEADTSDDPLEVKVLRDKPADAVNACWTTGERMADWAQCQELNPTYGNPRLAAGGPLAGDVLKCQLKPLDSADYGVEFNDAQRQRLQAAFPDGVCDYSRPGVAQQPSIPWLTYLAGDGGAIPGGDSLGAVPVSVPFGPDGDVCADVPVAPVVDRRRARVVHRPAVDCVIYTRISVGVTADRYGPQRPVSRGQMATFVVNTLRAAGVISQLPPGGGEPEFVDIAGNVHAGNINRLARADVVAGVGRRRFDPDAAITRAQMASFMVAAARLADMDLQRPDDHFADVRGAHTDSINAGYQAGLFTGTTAPQDGVARSGRFSPGRDVLRDQMATFLINLLQLTSGAAA